ncbi:hypothetical protein GCM10022219_04630 [Microbacterium oryzae]|uniref:Uncharacterized protein n=1 Tax=Microbacterium oryzae TaxID=743009 RepID=A0A6I6DY67_9MICO|nr:hypothetical protein [Microbacterium oryzae]QGU26599.1 hypothetical protein D7D94_02060 [Microbacterium oryzae]
MSWDGVLAGEREISESTGAYRPIRHVQPPAVPVAGELATCGDDVVQLVRAEALDDWAGWRAAGHAHVLSPRDVVRLADGHALVLPWCVAKLEVWLAARTASGPPLAGGEVVTLAVSLLRGVQEAWDGRTGHEQGPIGEWWLTDEARPIFAERAGGEQPEVSARRVLEGIARGSADRVLRRVLEEAVTALERPRGLHRAVDAIEGRLFEACAPRALALETRAVEDAVPDVERAALSSDGTAQAVGTWLDRHVDAGVAALAAGAWDSLGGILAAIGRPRSGRRAPGSARSRRAPLLVGAVCAGAVLLVGAVWPGEGSAEADAPPASVEPSTSEEPTAMADASAPPSGPAKPTPTPPVTPAEESPEEATARLVEGVAADEVALVDDFGDVAVTRIAQDAGHRHVVLERVAGEWRVRQLYETAKGAG